MKIAIQGHPTRGKEVIQILKSLSGKNCGDLDGRRIDQCYFINSNGDIDLHYRSRLFDYKFYTLEEFEEKFPFKIGDIVLIKGVYDPNEVIALEWYANKLCYKLDNGFHYAPERLTTYEKMKEKRNITLTLDKAKEWYNKGGELKEVALQAFTEKELSKVELPKTWKEFCENYPAKKGEYFINNYSEIVQLGESNAGRDSKIDKNLCPSKKSAEAHLAMIQLEQLRDCWRQGWKPDWDDDQQSKYCIVYHQGKIKVNTLYESRHFLSFPTREMAEEFLKCFRDLIEKAEDLI